MDQRIDGLDQKIVILDQKIDNNTKEIRKLHTITSENGKKIDRNAVKIDEIQDNLESLARMTKNGFDEVHARIDQRIYETVSSVKK